MQATESAVEEGGNCINWHDTTRHDTTVSTECGVHHAAAWILVGEQEKRHYNSTSDARVMTSFSTIETFWKDIKNQYPPCPWRWKQHVPTKAYHPSTSRYDATARRSHYGPSAPSKAKSYNASRTDHYTTISSTFLYSTSEKEHEVCLALWKVSLTETISLACLCSNIATLMTAQRNKRNR